MSRLEKGLMWGLAIAAVVLALSGLSGCGTCLERTPDGRGVTVCGGLS